MHRRGLGNTGARVSEVGLGCNRLGQPYASAAHWVRLVRRAVDLGVSLLDTSESYGWGQSEEMLGRALGNRDDVLVATKASRLRETDEKDFSAQHVMAAAEGSLRRLQREQIDIYQLHSPSREDLQRFDWAEGMARLKEQGKIRFSGVAVNSAADGVWLLQQGLVQVLQITYNLFVTEAAEDLFDLAWDRGVGLLCRMPLARGVLTGKFRPGQKVPEGHRALLDGPRMAENIERAELLRPLGAAYEGGMTRLALRFSLTPRAISAIIPGARTLAQLEENVAASNGVGLSFEMQRQVEQVQARWAA